MKKTLLRTLLREQEQKTKIYAKSTNSNKKDLKLFLDSILKEGEEILKVEMSYDNGEHSLTRWYTPRDFDCGIHELYDFCYS